MRLFSTLLLLAGVASSCQSCDEYLLSGTFALGSEFRLLTDGSFFTDGELSVERGAESRNSATLRLWKTGGCQVSLTWPIDARGETPTQGSLYCGANLDDLGGTVLIQDLQVDSWDESENGDTGARLTIDLGAFGPRASRCCPAQARWASERWARAEEAEAREAPAPTGAPVAAA